MMPQNIVMLKYNEHYVLDRNKVDIGNKKSQDKFT